MNGPKLVSDIVKSLNERIFADIKALENYRKNVWFWKEVVRRNLLRFLEFAVEPTLVGTAENLLYAYTYSGTMEGIIRLSKGLFGDRSIIIVDDKDPAVIDIEIKNANTNFLYALAQNDYALAIEERFAASTSDLADVISYDPLQFFRNFLTPGRVLRRLNINTYREGEDAH